MAMSNNKSSMFFNFFLMISVVLLIISVAEGRLFGIGFGKAKSAPTCVSVFGARDGDTCFGVTQMFNLTAEFFGKINPNLDCTKVFVGEWLCVDGVPS